MHRYLPLKKPNTSIACCRPYETKTSDKIIVVTINPDSATILSVADFAQYARLLLKTWEFGNGMGIIFSPALRYIRIETSYGFEARLIDAKAQQVLDEIILPWFKRHAYFEGITGGLQAIFKELNE